jgi:hypothetical protein
MQIHTAIKPGRLLILYRYLVHNIRRNSEVVRRSAGYERRAEAACERFAGIRIVALYDVVHATLESEEERVAGRGGDGGGGEGEPVHTGGYSAEAEIARIERGWRRIVRALLFKDLIQVDWKTNSFQGGKCVGAPKVMALQLSIGWHIDIVLIW